MIYLPPYAVREPGQPAWATDLRTAADARCALAEALAAGLYRAAIYDVAGAELEPGPINAVNIGDAHTFLCHPNGEPCIDGRDTAADPARLDLYRATPAEAFAGWLRLLAAAGQVRG